VNGTIYPGILRRVVLRMSPDVSEEHVASTFNVEEYVEQETRVTCSSETEDSAIHDLRCDSLWDERSAS
jgi:hypothetical protein